MAPSAFFLFPKQYGWVEKNLTLFGVISKPEPRTLGAALCKLREEKIKLVYPAY